MTLRTYNTTDFTTLDIDNVFSGDTVLVGSQAMVVSTETYGFNIVASSGSGFHFVINGTIGAKFGAIIATNLVFDVDIHIGKTGVLFGDEAIGFTSQNPHIFNEGLITATSVAIHLGGILGMGHDISIINYGTIAGGTYSIALYEGTLERTVLDNHGIIGSSIASVAFGSSDTTFTDDIIRNSGDIYGDVYMGGGNDLMDSRHGNTQGTIFLGPGDDRYLPGLTEETVNGGTGFSRDVIDFRFTSGVTFALDGSLDATGVAAGDVYSGFANLTGSGSGADRLRGDVQANRLTGLGGADVLEGMAGNDFFIGGNGSDTLTGGVGYDTFQYNRAFEAPDVITDFSNVAGNNDGFQFVRSSFDPTLTAGPIAAAMFQTRADNLAQDADDRFILRTTDKTLWYDADGNGAQAAFMIADLQASASVTALDILIV